MTSTALTVLPLADCKTLVASNSWLKTAVAVVTGAGLIADCARTACPKCGIGGPNHPTHDELVGLDDLLCTCGHRWTREPPALSVATPRHR